MTIINHPGLFDIESSEEFRTRRKEKTIYLRRFRDNNAQTQRGYIIRTPLSAHSVSCPLTPEYWVVTVCLLSTVICLKCHTANTLFSLMMPQRSARFESNWVGCWCSDRSERGTNKSWSQKTAWGINIWLASFIRPLLIGYIWWKESMKCDMCKGLLSHFPTSISLTQKWDCEEVRVDQTTEQELQKSELIVGWSSHTSTQSNHTFTDKYINIFDIHYSQKHLVVLFTFIFPSVNTPVSSETVTWLCRGF